MDAYFASVEQQLNPALRGKPVIVCGNPNLRTVVAAASYEAKRKGVKTGMSIREALDVCPDVRIVPGDPIRYAETSKEIFRCASDFTDRLEVASIDEGFLDLTGIADLWGGKSALGAALKRRIRQRTGLPCTIGIAPNKLVAKIVADRAKPDGLQVVEPGDVPAYMAHLPVEEIPGIGPRLSSRLADLGITTCADVRKMGEQFFTSRFGAYGSFIFRAAHGQDDTPVVVTPPEPKSMGHSYTLPFDTLDFAFLRSVLFRLCEQVASRMRQGEFCGNVVTCVVRLSDFTTIVRQRVCRGIPPDGRRIFHAAWELFLSFSVSRPVRLLGVSVGGLHHSSDMPLFPDEIRREHLYRCVDDTNARFGEESVFPATFLMEKQVAARVVKTHAFSFWQFRERKNGR